MAFPPAVLPTNRTNATVQQDTHPADHNSVNAAVNDLVTELVARGLKAWDTGATTDLPPTAVATDQGVGLNVLFTAVAGRKYLIHAGCTLNNATGAAGICTFNIRSATPAAYLVQRSWSVGAGQIWSPSIAYVLEGAVGPMDLSCNISGLIGVSVVGTNARQGFMSVECVA